MEEVEEGYVQDNQSINESGTRIRDLEERQRLLKDRIILIGNSLVDIRERNVRELQEIKKTLTVIQEEMKMMKSVLQKVNEKIDTCVQEGDMQILQRQFDLFRGA